MSKAKELFDQLRGGEQRTGAMEAVKEGAQLVASRMSLSTILNEVGKEMKEQVKHGAHELAAALFNGSAFVMYPRQAQGKDDQQHGLPQQAQQEQHQEQGRNGREM
jgi:hypothetical protein